MSNEKITPLEVSLTPKKQDFISVHPLCCLHLGAVNCDIDKIKQLLAQINKDPNSYIIMAGDTCENVTASSAAKHKGSMFDQNLNPKDQVKLAVELLKPLQHKILAMLESNHSLRSWQETQFSIEETISDKLRVPFLNTDGLFHIKVGSQIYKIHVTHGAGGCSTAGGVIQKVMYHANRFQGMDCHVNGHYHTPVVTKRDIFDSDGNKSTKTFVATGSFLSYVDSYAHRALYMPSYLGIPELQLFNKTHEIKVLI